MSVSLFLVAQVHATLKRSNTLSDINECYPSTIATEDQVRLAEEGCLGQAATGRRDEYMKQKKMNLEAKQVAPKSQLHVY